MGEGKGVKKPHFIKKRGKGQSETYNAADDEKSLETDYPDAVSELQRCFDEPDNKVLLFGGEGCSCTRIARAFCKNESPL